jgi:hypothetical protein
MIKFLFIYALLMKDDRQFYQLNYELPVEPDHAPYI